MAAGSAAPAASANIVVFGGSGGTGSECVVQALAMGAKVTAGRFRGYSDRMQNTLTTLSTPSQYLYVSRVTGQ